MAPWVRFSLIPRIANDLSEIPSRTVASRSETGGQLLGSGVLVYLTGRLRDGFQVSANAVYQALTAPECGTISL